MHKVLRQAELEDYKLIYNLRFSKEAIDNSLTKIKPTLAQHKDWFKNHYQEYKIYQNIAFLRQEKDGNISIVVDKKHQGKGIATKLLNTIESGKAMILINNTSSLRCFIKGGFNIRGFYLEKN